MTGNQGGGFKFSNAGELNPSVQIEGCRVQNCGYKLLNITSPPVIDLYVQNSKLLTISNNFIGQCLNLNYVLMIIMYVARTINVKPFYLKLANVHDVWARHTYGHTDLYAVL